MYYKDLELRKKRIRVFLRKNPKATYNDIRKKLHIKLERVYNKGMTEAFKNAGIKPPRTFKKKSVEEKRSIVINYIRKNPKVGGHIIRRDTKINLPSIFKSTKEAFDMAGVEYNLPRWLDKRIKQKKKTKIIDLIKKNPLISITEISKKTNTNPYLFFRNVNDIYRQAKVKYINRAEKRMLKKRSQIIKFVKKNPYATQKEINAACKTHVQDRFSKGIFEAYKIAGVEFPYERLKLYGTATKDIKKRAKTFEDEMAIKLSGYGSINRLVKTKRGFADIVLERKGNKAIIEIKDYMAKDVSISEIKQVNKYLEDCNCNLGILICHKKPKKDKFLIGNKRIFIIEGSELTKIPQLMGS